MNASLVYRLLAAHDGPCPDVNDRRCCRCEAADVIDELFTGLASAATALTAAHLNTGVLTMTIERLTEEVDRTKRALSQGDAEVGRLLDIIDCYQAMLGPQFGSADDTD